MGFSLYGLDSVRRWAELKDRKDKIFHVRNEYMNEIRTHKGEYRDVELTSQELLEIKNKIRKRFQDERKRNIKVTITVSFIFIIVIAIFTYWYFFFGRPITFR